MKSLEDLTALAEIVDALAGTLSTNDPANETLKSIAQRAQKLYRRRVEDPQP